MFQTETAAAADTATYINPFGGVCGEGKKKKKIGQAAAESSKPPMKRLKLTLLNVMILKHVEENTHRYWETHMRMHALQCLDWIGGVFPDTARAK